MVVDLDPQKSRVVSVFCALLAVSSARADEQLALNSKQQPRAVEDARMVLSSNDSFSVFDTDSFALQRVHLRHEVDFKDRVLVSEVVHTVLVTRLATAIDFDAGPGLEVQKTARVSPSNGSPYQANVEHRDGRARVSFDGELQPGTLVDVALRSQTTERTPADAVPWNAKPELVYTFLQATKARDVYPAVDRVDVRVPYQIDVVVRSDLQVFGPGAKSGPVSLGDGRVLFSFSAGRQVAYLATFVAGKLASEVISTAPLVEVIFDPEIRDDALAAARRFPMFVRRVAQAFGVEAPPVSFVFASGFTFSGMEVTPILLNVGHAKARGAMDTTALHEIIHLVGFGGTQSVFGSAMRDAAVVHESTTSYFDMALLDDPSLQRAKSLEALRVAETADSSVPLVTDPFSREAVDEVSWDPARTYRGGALRLRQCATIVGEEALHVRAAELVQQKKGGVVRATEMFQYLTQDWPETGAPNRMRFLQQLLFEPLWPSLDVSFDVGRLSLKSRGSRSLFGVVPVTFFGPSGVVRSDRVVFDGTTERVVAVPQGASGAFVDPDLVFAGSINFKTAFPAVRDAVQLSDQIGIRGMTQVLSAASAGDLRAMLAHTQHDKVKRALIQGTLARLENRKSIGNELEDIQSLGDPVSLVAQGLLLTSFAEGRIDANGSMTAEDRAIVARAARDAAKIANGFDLQVNAAVVVQKIPGAELPAEAAEAAAYTFRATTRNRAVKPFAKALVRVRDDVALRGAADALIGNPAHLVVVEQAARVLRGEGAGAERFVNVVRGMDGLSGDVLVNQERFLELVGD